MRRGLERLLRSARSAAPARLRRPQVVGPADRVGSTFLTPNAKLTGAPLVRVRVERLVGHQLVV